MTLKSDINKTFTLRKDGMPFGSCDCESLQAATDKLTESIRKVKRLTLSHLSEELAVFTTSNGHQYVIAEG